MPAALAWTLLSLRRVKLESPNPVRRERRLTIRISIDAGQRATTLRIDGHLTAADLPDVRASCESAKPPLRLDLSGLRSADIDGIRALLSLSENGAELRGASPYIGELLLKADR